MRLALLVVASLAFSTVVIAAAPSASACIPPNCPGFGKCTINEDGWRFDPSRPLDTPKPIECYY